MRAAATAIALILVVLALGLFSSLLFAWQWLSGALTTGSALVIALLVAGTGLWVFFRLKRGLPKTPAVSGASWIILAVSLAVASYFAFQYTKILPEGGWDAWAVWNLHARFLYRGRTGLWLHLFDPGLGWSQNDYPLLLPGLISGVWAIIGSEQHIVPVLVAHMFALLSVAIVCTAVCALSGDQRGWLAGLLILATPSFVLVPSAQLADVPLSLYILTTVVLLQFASAWPSMKTPMLLLAGLSAGCAAWTKNEGLLFVLTIFIAHLAFTALHGIARHYWRDALTIGLGLAPMFVLIVLFKTLLSPPGDITLDRAAVERALTLSRYPQIATAFMAKLAGFGDATGGVHPGVLAGLYVLFYWMRDRKLSRTALVSLLLPLLMLAGYFAVYVITPYDLQWHLNTSLGRLILQVWPASLFLLTLLPGRRGGDADSASSVELTDSASLVQASK